MLPVSLPSLLVQDYPGDARIILVDDCSSDGTGQLARDLAAGYGGFPLTVVTPGEPEQGWTGKLWALRHGIAVARRDKPDFLLLTDADIAHEPDSLRDLVAAAGLGAGRLRPGVADGAAAGGERLGAAGGARVRVLLRAALPVPPGEPGPVADGGRGGGCVLLRTEAAERARIPDSIRQAVIDDVSLAREVRRSGGRIWLGLAERVDSVRPYPRLADLWRMVARSAYAQLRHSPLLLAGTVPGLLLVYVAPPATLVAGLLTGDGAAAWAGGAAWAVMTATYLPMLAYYRQSLWLGPLLPLTAVLYLLMTVDSAVQHYRGGRRLEGPYVHAPGGRARPVTPREDGRSVRAGVAGHLPGAGHLRPGVQFMPQP